MVAIFIFVFSAPVFAMAPEVDALEPSLLWEKKFDKRVRSVILAKDSGDVVISIKDEIFLFDKNGNETSHWGPRLDRVSGNVDISSDGKIVVYTTHLRETYKEKKKLIDWDHRVHYVTRSGKELWNKSWPGFVKVSSSGSKLIMNYGYGEGNGFDVLDAKGNKLWGDSADDWGAISAELSEDGEHLAVVGDLQQPLRLYKASDGTLLWESDGYEDGVLSIADNASYMSTSPAKSHSEKIYDRNGNIILDGYSILSRDGTRALLLEENSVSVITLPEKLVIGEYSVTPATWYYARNAAFSNNGHYLAIIGSKEDPSDNLFVIETNTGQIWSTTVNANGTVISITNDGRHLLVSDLNKK